MNELTNNKLAFRKKFIVICSLFIVLGLLQPRIVAAHCPLCVVGAATGLTFSRVLGIDDSITGVWIGALLGASTFWLQRILGTRKNIFLKKGMGIFLYLVIFASTIWSFYRFNLVVQHGDIFGWDKLTFGIVFGGVVFYMVDLLNGRLRKKDGKRIFPYQGVILSLGSIVVTSLAIYILINYYI